MKRYTRLNKIDGRFVQFGGTPEGVRRIVFSCKGRTGGVRPERLRDGQPRRTAARRSCRREAGVRGCRGTRDTCAAAHTSQTPKRPGAERHTGRGAAAPQRRGGRSDGKGGAAARRGAAQRTAERRQAPHPRPGCRGAPRDDPPRGGAQRPHPRRRRRAATARDAAGAQHSRSRKARRGRRNRGSQTAAAGGTPGGERAGQPPERRAAPRPGRAERQRTERSEGSTPAEPRSDAGRGAAPRRGTGDAAEGGAETGANVRRIPLKPRSAARQGENGARRQRAPPAPLCGGGEPSGAAICGSGSIPETCNFNCKRHEKATIRSRNSLQRCSSPYT